MMVLDFFIFFLTITMLFTFFKTYLIKVFLAMTVLNSNLVYGVDFSYFSMTILLTIRLTGLKTVLVVLKLTVSMTIDYTVRFLSSSCTWQYFLGSSGTVSDGRLSRGATTG
jgi:hypothetical protein